MVTEEQIKRINELAHKSKKEGLTPAEKEEQKVLRRAYLDAVRESLEGQLDNIYILEPDGTERKVTKKEESPEKGTAQPQHPA